MNQSSLPAIDSPFVAGALARCRALYARWLTPKKKPVSLQACLWDAVLDDRDRRFLCHLAKLPVQLAERSAAELTAGELYTLFDSFLKLRGWCGKVERALQRIRSEMPA